MQSKRRKRGYGFKKTKHTSIVLARGERACKEAIVDVLAEIVHNMLKRDLLSIQQKEKKNNKILAIIQRAGGERKEV